MSKSNAAPTLSNSTHHIHTLSQSPISEGHFLSTGSIRLHYLRYAGAGPVLMLLHGLTANGYAFEGLMQAGLGAGYNVVAPDLRGRGLSDHPAFRYSIEEHTEDMLALIESLGVERVHICGHSFGGFLGAYLAAKHPEKVDKLVLLDAGIQMNSQIGEMLMPRLMMLEKVFPSWDDYLAYVKAAPFLAGFWDEALEAYYRADIKEVEDGVTPRPTLANIIEASKALGAQPWREILPQVQQPTLLLHAHEAYTLGEPLLWEHDARETVDLMPQARYAAVPGNHQTMLYGEGAKEIARQVQDFLG